VLLNWLVTQLVAAALHYPPFFMGRIIGQVYQPFAWWWWQYHWPRNAVHRAQHHSFRAGLDAVPPIVFYPPIGAAGNRRTYKRPLVQRRRNSRFARQRELGRHAGGAQSRVVLRVSRCIYLAT
jgi:hypothetical protein